MASVILDKPDIALFSDVENTYLVLDYLVVQNPTQVGDGAFTRFEGRSRPTGGRSEGFHKTWEFSVVFGKHQHEDAIHLLSLFDEAYHAPDARLQVRLAGGEVEGLDPLQVVEVHEWTPFRQPGGVVQVEFKATEVSYSLDLDSDIEHSTFLHVH